jgi:hypothetical protein
LDFEIFYLVVLNKTQTQNTLFGASEDVMRRRNFFPGGAVIPSMTSMKFCYRVAAQCIFILRRRTRRRKQRLDFCVVLSSLVEMGGKSLARTRG